MALQDILKKIIDDAQGEVKNLEAEFEQKKLALKEQSDEMLKEEIAELKTRSTEAKAAVMKKVESMAARENKNALLVAKNNAIEKALKQFLSHLENADDELYNKVLKALFAPIGDTSGRIFVSKKRMTITKKHAPKDCTFFEDDSIVGGFVFRGVDTEIDNSFENIVFSEAKSTLSSYVADQLKLI